MTFSAGPNPLAYAGINPDAQPFTTAVNRAPTTNDWQSFSPGNMWRDVSVNPPVTYLLESVASNSAVWKPITQTTATPVASLIPNSGTSPVVPNASGQIALVGSGSITTVGSTNTLTARLTGLTNHSVLVGAGTDTITSLAVATSGTVLAGSTGNDPSFTATPSVTSITFGGGSSLSSYVEGTFTPNFAFGGGSTGITYGGANSGYYTRIGNVVFVGGILQLSNLGSDVGEATMTNLPFTVKSGTNPMCVVGSLNNVFLAPGYTILNGQFLSGTTSMALIESNPLGGVPSNLVDASFTATCSYYFNGWYTI